MWQTLPSGVIAQVFDRKPNRSNSELVELLSKIYLTCKVKPMKPWKPPSQTLTTCVKWIGLEIGYLSEFLWFLTFIIYHFYTLYFPLKNHRFLREKNQSQSHLRQGLEREKQPGLLELFKKMISIPFELNKKCALCRRCRYLGQWRFHQQSWGYRDTWYKNTHLYIYIYIILYIYILYIYIYTLYIYINLSTDQRVKMVGAGSFIFLILSPARGCCKLCCFAGAQAASTCRPLDPFSWPLIRKRRARDST